MTGLDELLYAIHANPEEDLPRLVYADALDEHGDEWRAENIRSDVATQRRHFEHIRFQCFEPSYIDFKSRDDLRFVPQIREADWVELFVGWHRGFIYEIGGPIENLLAVGAKVVTEHPVQRIILAPSRLFFREQFRASLAKPEFYCIIHPDFTIPEKAFFHRRYDELSIVPFIASELLKYLRRVAGVPNPCPPKSPAWRGFLNP